jgi:hypothetical protein
VASNSGAGGGFTFGVDVLARYAYFEVGALYGYTFRGIANESMTTKAGLVGFGYHEWDQVAFDLLLSGGVHDYVGVGGTTLFGDPGGRGTAPFMGMRAGVTFHTAGRVRFTYGMWLFLEDDVSRRSVTYSYDEGLIEPRVHRQGSATIGDYMVGGIARAGFDFVP